MMPPEKILIPFDDYRFKTTGKFANGRQYMAFVTGAFPGKARLAPANWRDIKRWIAVIHIFEWDGTYRNSDARLVGFAREEPQLYTKMNLMFEVLRADYGINESQFCDIWVKPFSVVIDDITYELIYETEEYSENIHEQATLWPNDVVFYPPWNNGRYDT